MKTNDYEEAKSLLRHIDSISSQVDMVKEQWSALMDGGGTAKLLICAGGKSCEITLTEDTVIVTLNAILEKYRRIIRESQDRLNELIVCNTPIERNIQL